MLKKRVCLLIVISFAFSLLPGCTSQPAATTTPATVSTEPPIPSPTATQTPAPTSASEPTLSPYQELIADTYLSSGNNMRMKNVIEKARNGEPVNIACIGGSVTEGYLVSRSDCYVNQFYEMFKAQYGKDGGENIKYVNAGMSGTNSAIGWTRYERDVTKALGGNPDIFVVEFAINDYEDQSITKGAALESMIRDVLSLPNQPAVILLFSSNWDWGNLQDLHIPLGNAYELPMVSMRNGITPHIKNGDIAVDDFFLSDHDHPTALGHKLMAEALMYCVDTIDKETAAETDITLPDTPVITGGLNYQGMNAIYQGDALPDGLTLTLGSFTAVDTATGGFEYNEKPKYPANWKRDTASNDPFVIEVNCKNMLLVYKSADGYGKADIYLDGEKIQTVDGSQGGGWDNAVAALLFNNEVSENHKIEIRMADDNEAKGFTIFAFSYTE